MLEATVVAHAGVEGVLAGMTEGRVAEIVCQADGLDEILVEPQRARHRAGNLGDFQRVRETGAIQISLVIDEDLGLVDETPERGRVNDPIPVALKFSAICWRFLIVAPAARRSVMCCVAS